MNSSIPLVLVLLLLSLFSSICWYRVSKTKRRHRSREPSWWSPTTNRSSFIMPLRSRRIERQERKKTSEKGIKKVKQRKGVFTTRRRPLGCWVVGWLVVVVVFFFFLFSLCDLNLLFVESDKIVVKKKGKEKTNFFAWKFQKKNNPQKLLPRKKKNVRFVLRIKRERERERDEEDGGCICCPCD